MNIKKYFLSAAISLLLITQAHADMSCRINDIKGNSVTYYSFRGNSSNETETAGTLVETGFTRNGVTTTYEADIRPIWWFIVKRDGGWVISSRNDPGWHIITYQFNVPNEGGILARLVHNGNEFGYGSCKGYTPVIHGNNPDENQY